MPVPSEIYRPPLGLLTDFYELTMAYAAWKEGAARLPVGKRAHVFLRDALAVHVPGERLEDDPERHREARYRAEALLLEGGQG